MLAPGTGAPVKASSPANSTSKSVHPTQQMVWKAGRQSNEATAATRPTTNHCPQLRREKRMASPGPHASDCRSPGTTGTAGKPTAGTRALAGLRNREAHSKYFIYTVPRRATRTVPNALSQSVNYTGFTQPRRISGSQARTAVSSHGPAKRPRRTRCKSRRWPPRMKPAHNTKHTVQQSPTRRQ